MSKGWALHQLEGQWHSEECTRATISDTKCELDLLDGEGDTITVTASSEDGVTYRGTYHYREGSYSDGEVVLERYRARPGNMFVGEWREVGGTKGTWIIKVAIET